MPDTGRYLACRSRYSNPSLWGAFAIDRIAAFGAGFMPSRCRLSRHHRDYEHGGEGKATAILPFMSTSISKKAPALDRGLDGGRGHCCWGRGWLAPAVQILNAIRLGLVPMFGRQLAGFLPRQLLLAQNETGPFC